MINNNNFDIIKLLSIITNIILIKISAKRLTISSFKKYHITKKYLGWINDKNNLRFSRHKKIYYNKKKALSFYRKITLDKNLFLCIKDNQTKKLIGTMIAYLDQNRNEANIGIMIGEKKISNKGYGYEAFSNLQKHLKKKLNVKLLTAGVNSNKNFKMIKLAKKLNMKFIYKKKNKKINYFGKTYDGTILFVKKIT